nr:MaoC/PaaZ C-terminal domain-containing protein [Corynebacterium parakroppenstedtii]
MNAMNSPDFPFLTVGTIHIRNVIEQYSPIAVTDSIDVAVYTESLRRHRQGLLIDIITEVRRSSAPDDVVWRQRSTMLSKGKAPEGQLPDDNYSRMSVDLPEDPTTIMRVSTSDIKNYANVSGDKNPIHVSRLGAKAFGFPATIAHGMWSAASLLSVVEGEIPSRARYTVEFGKPIILPAVLAAYSSRHPQNDSNGLSWDLRYCSAKDSSKINVTAQLAEI